MRKPLQTVVNVLYRLPEEEQERVVTQLLSDVRTRQQEASRADGPSEGDIYL
jgi:hypothetical protein